MKAVSKNISRHENGILYFRGRVAGKVETVSLGTKVLEEAKKILREKGFAGVKALQAARMAAFLPEGGGVRPPPPVSPPSTVRVALCDDVPPVAPGAPAVSLAQAVEKHGTTLVLMSKGAEEMAARGKRVVLKYCMGWEDFSPVRIWNAYRKSGVDSPRKKEFTSAANHLRWYLRSFVPWAVERGYLPAALEKELEKVRKVKVNPRRIVVPEPAAVDEFLRMIETEDKQGAAFLRFLATSGLRLSGAINLRWRDIDFVREEMMVLQKGGRYISTPMTPEAVAVLRSRQGQPQPHAGPWACMGEAELAFLKRRMKNFGNGLGVDLTTFHAFRHYFASRCLLSGIGVKEVAALLAHQDGGALVLSTYGHLCASHLRDAVKGLRLAGSAVPENGPSGCSSEGTAAA